MDKPNQNQQGNQGQNQSGNQQGNQKQQGAPTQAPMNMLPTNAQSQSDKQKSAMQPQKTSTPAATANSNWNYTLMWIVLVLVVIGAGWWIGGSSLSTDSTMSNNGTTTDETSTSGLTENGGTSSGTGLVPVRPTTPDSPAPISGVGNSVEVVAQAAGDSVRIESATLSRLGWIGVLDSRDWVLGAARFMGGKHGNVFVPLLRATESGQSYKAVIYLDDGDGQFDHKKDARTDIAVSFVAN